MKNSLIGHINMIFQTLHIESGFDVYDCLHDDLPEWMNQLSHSQQYIICTKAVNQIDKLKVFIGKDISLLKEYAYWYDGEVIEQTNSLPINSYTFTSGTINSLSEIEQLKTHTRLPGWLDEYIFKELNAEYAPNHDKFEHNLELSDSDIKKYLGTYFPRSYSEAFCILDNLFQNAGYGMRFKDSSTLNICVIGCGTGGDLMGLLTVLEKYSSFNKDISIVVIDGNRSALNTLERIVNKFNQRIHSNISLRKIEHIFYDITFFNLEIIGEMHSFDFVMSSKMVGEIISAGNGLNENAYYDFLKKFLPLLNEKGVLYLLDVTTRQKHSTYNPFLMNEQVTCAMKEMRDYRIISPRPCCIYNNTCSHSCFHQKTFTISHSRVNNDKSKVAYKIIVHQELASIIGIPQNDATLYLIHNDKPCPNTALGDGNTCDAFYIPKTNLTHIAKPSIETETHSVSGSNVDYELISSDTLHPQIISPIDNIDDDTADINNDTEATEYYIGCYVIDTNVFLDKPDILQTISDEYFVVLSAKVLDELDHLKTKKNISPARKKRVTKALKNISECLSDENMEIIMEYSDTRLLPKDFDKNCPDNMILSVAMKFLDENPILLTSDYGLQARAKGLGIKSISLKEYTKSN